MPKETRFMVATEADPTTPDHLLLKAIANWTSGAKACRAAMATFYRRYQPELRKRCWRFRGRLGGSQGLDDLVQETFSRARRGAKTFVVDPSLDPEIQSR